MIAWILCAAFKCRLTTSLRLHHACAAAGPVIVCAWFHEDCGGAIVAGGRPCRQGHPRVLFEYVLDLLRDMPDLLICQFGVDRQRQALLCHLVADR